MAKKIRTIPATINRFTAVPINEHRKRRTAGYARVSTDEEDQATSYAAQIDYYTKYINNHMEWEFVKIYTDAGISGTNTKYRSGFKQMIKDALDGKIDLIITKSVSRFARNTVDSLTTVRKLKEKGIEVYFEKENIWTLDSKGELLITIMSSLAQEESRSISENITWGQRKRFADGKVSVAYSHFLGYDKGEDDKMIVNYQEAETIKLIYKLYLSGFSLRAIARELTKRKIKTAYGKDTWCVGPVQGILTNEKYKGDALLQKEYTVDYLTKTVKKNEGEIPQYYIENDHEAIISSEIFDMVQAEMAKRRHCKTRYSGISIFSNKIKCGDCGGWYGSKVWHSTDKYRKIIYQCNGKFKNHCQTPHIAEEQIKAAFIVSFNKIFKSKETVLENMEILQKGLFSNKELQHEKQKVADEMRILADMAQECIDKNAHIVQNQEDYKKHYDELVGKYNEKKSAFENLESTIADRKAKKAHFVEFTNMLQTQQELLDSFDERLWCSMVEYMTIYKDGSTKVMFKNGEEI